MPIYTDSVPDVSIRGDIVIIGPLDNGIRVCSTVSSFRQFVRRSQAALAIFDAQESNVVELRCAEH
jgi:hypothetical protein